MEIQPFLLAEMQLQTCKNENYLKVSSCNKKLRQNWEPPNLDRAHADKLQLLRSAIWYFTRGPLAKVMYLEYNVSANSVSNRGWVPNSVTQKNRSSMKSSIFLQMEHEFVVKLKPMAVHHLDVEC